MTNPHPYLHPPVQLIKHVTSHVTSSDVCQSHPHVVLLRKYQESLDDYTQGEVLLGLGLGEQFFFLVWFLDGSILIFFCTVGIDVEQFTNDPSYKRDIILSLARCIDELYSSFSIMQQILVSLHFTGALTLRCVQPLCLLPVAIVSLNGKSTCP